MAETPTEEGPTTTSLEADEEALGSSKIVAEVGEDFEEEEIPVPAQRLAVVVAFSTMAAAVMAGGVFQGFSPRIWGALAGLMGIALAVLVRRIKNFIFLNLVVLLGIVVISLIVSAPGGAIGDIVNIGPFVREAVTSGDVRRPPVPFDLGWRAILGTLMGGLGFAAAWIAITFKKPAIGLMTPLPIVVIGAISVAESAKLASGLGALVLFAIGLGLLSGVDLGEREQRSVAYELRRAARALPLIGAITVGLYFMAQADFLFPPPVFDPTQTAQRPRTRSLSEVPDRVLFTVKSLVTGPWRMGGLDVYEEGEWLLPPFAENRIRAVPRSGLVDSELQPGLKAEFEVLGLDGAVLPGLPDMVGIVAEGPSLAYDSRTGNIRLAEGVVQPGISYIVTAARIPTVEELRNVTGVAPEEVRKFLEVPPPPPAVVELMNRANFSSLWDKLDFMRTELLNTVAASGAGTPVPIPPERVQEILTTKEATPFELVATQALLARWVGIPSRIGYGYDGGEKVGEALEVRPKHGAAFLEIYFRGYKWLPIIGTPVLAKSNISSAENQTNSDVLPSDDISVQVVLPFEIDPTTYLQQQVIAIVTTVVPLILGLLLLYYGWPGVKKAILRGRRRNWALSTGAEARIAVSYAEWRDNATDFGYLHTSDTPLMFLDRVVEDEEHTELAWLATRCLWGDISEELTEEDAKAAEELSRSLRRRLGQGHSWTLRTIATVSRLSLRNPYGPRLWSMTKTSRRRGAKTSEEEKVGQPA